MRTARLISCAPRAGAPSRRAIPACRRREREEVTSTSGKAAGCFASAAVVSAMRFSSSAGFDLIGLGQHDLIAHGRFVERLQHVEVDVLDAVAGVDQHVDPRQRGCGPAGICGSARSRTRPWPSAPRRSHSRACRPAGSRTFRGPSKKISSWVRPGVCEVRASALRPVSALIRLDLPTLERPANATSMPAIGGSVSIEGEAQMNCQSPANSFRPCFDQLRIDVGGHAKALDFVTASLRGRSDVAAGSRHSVMAAGPDPESRDSGFDAALAPE